MKRFDRSNGLDLSLPLFPFVRGEVMPATCSLPKVAAIIKGLGRHSRCSAALADLQCGFKSEFSFS